MDKTEIILDLIRTRRSIRRYKEGAEPIPAEDIEKILDAARYAPSPENMQMHRFIAIRDDQGTKEFIGKISKEISAYVFGHVPYELTTGRLWYLPGRNRPATFEDMKDGDLFLYPARADTVIMAMASETWHDANMLYPNDLFGSVVAGMAMIQMWLVAHSMGYAAAYQAFPFSDPRHAELIADRLGVPRTWKPLACLCIGRPQAPRMLGPSRFPLEGIVYSERWGVPFKRRAFSEVEEED
ncbi:MAG: nitroreductase family protein [Candidatus Hodarchaeota archaeon]